MPRKKTSERQPAAVIGVEEGAGYDLLVSGIAGLLDQSRRSAVRSVNSILSATYWEIGRRIVPFEQGGKARAEYGEGLWKRLSADLTARYGRGFSKSNLAQMRAFYLGWELFQTASGKLAARARCAVAEASGVEKLSTASTILQPPTSQALAPSLADALADLFPLPWSHYVRLLSVEYPAARAFYEAEALRGGWSVRQLDR